MDACGFPEFLANVDEAQAQFDTTSDSLAALAEVVLRGPNPPIVEVMEIGSPIENASRHGLPPAQWEGWLRQANLDPDGRLENTKSSQAKSTVIGNVLTPLVGRVADAVVSDCAARVALRSTEGRGRRRYYYLEVARGANVESTPDHQASPPPPPPAPAGGSETPPRAEPVRCDGWLTSGPENQPHTGGGPSGSGEPWPARPTTSPHRR